MKLPLILVSLLYSMSAWSGAPVPAVDAELKQGSPYVPEGYGCIWHDEFDGVNCNENGCELDREYWQFQNVNARTTPAITITVFAMVCSVFMPGMRADG